MSRFRSFAIFAFSSFGIVLVLVCVSPATADGGSVQFSQVVAPYRVTVFTSPTPIQPGTVEISVLVQQMDSGDVVDDAIIDVELHSADPQRTIRQRATSETSTNQLMQSATVALPAAGRWHIAVSVQAASTIDVEFNVTAYESSDQLLTVVVCLAIPLLVIALFLLRENLIACQPAGTEIAIKSRAEKLQHRMWFDTSPTELKHEP